MLVLLILRDIHAIVKCVRDFCNMRKITPSGSLRSISEPLKHETVRRWLVTCDMFSFVHILPQQNAAVRQLKEVSQGGGGDVNTM